MPSKAKIREHWLPDLELLGKIDCDSTDRDCFCCGLTRELHRAHIKPLCQGGPNTVENLHLLCVRCHYESENLSDEGYWAWFVSKDIVQEYRAEYDRHRKIMSELLSLLGIAQVDIGRDKEKTAKVCDALGITFKGSLMERMCSNAKAIPNG